MFVNVECTGKEYDLLVKQLKEEKINYRTETTKQTTVDFWDDGRGEEKVKRTEWRYIVRFEVDEKLF